MMLRMADGPPPNLPPGLDAYAGYVNQSGIGVTWSQIVADHPDALHLSITTDGSAAMCADVERGAMGQWTGYPVGYSDASHAGLLIFNYGRPRKLWTAHHNDVPHICTSSKCWPSSPVDWVADGTQWTDHQGAWDESLLAADFFDFLPSPQPAQEMPMFLVETTDTKRTYAVFDSGKVSSIETGAFLTALTGTLVVHALPGTQADVDALAKGYCPN